MHPVSVITYVLNILDTFNTGVTMGRVQLVNAVICSMLTYSFHVYKWPSSLLSEVAKVMRNFIWSGSVDQKKICTVSWSQLCKPKKEGGLAVMDPVKLNQASLLHLTWQLLTSEESWAQLCKTRFLQNGRPKAHYITSSVWHGMKHNISLVLSHSKWYVGNGCNINFWADNWIERTIAEHWGIPHSILHSLSMKVFDCIVNGNWCLPAFFINKDATLASKIQTVTLPVDPLSDKLMWKSATDGELSHKIAYAFLNGTGKRAPWINLLWNTYIPPSRASITWRLLYNKLPIDENLRKRGCSIVSICCFCMNHSETSQHIFFTCPVTFQLWKWLCKGAYLSLDCSNCLTLLLGRIGVGSKMVQQTMNFAIIHTIWVIWIERN